MAQVNLYDPIEEPVWAQVLAVLEDDCPDGVRLLVDRNQYGALRVVPVKRGVAQEGVPCNREWLSLVVATQLSAPAARYTVSVAGGGHVAGMALTETVAVVLTTCGVTR